MRLVIDARFTRFDRHDGISRYGASLAAAIAEHADVVLLVHDRRQLPLLPDLPFVLMHSPLSPKELFSARTINRLQPDVVFCPMQTMGSWGRKYPLVLTLHDLIYYQNRTPPSFLPLPVRALWRLYHHGYWPQRLLLNRADVVATISRTTAGLIAQHRLTRRPVRIVGNAPQHAPASSAGPRQKSLIYMGSFMPYKNVETLITAMGALPDYTLHLLSRITPQRRRELEARLPPEAQVVFHNGVSDSQYESLLGTATALVSLSLAEGYGLPLIEAMAAGTPVIASDTPIFREVGGDAAILVDPHSPDAVARAVRSLDDPQHWREVVASGLSQASGYSWSASAAELLSAVETAQRVHSLR